MITIKLWNGTTIPRIGIGCWAIGGPMFDGDTAINYGEVDDAQSSAGLELALEMGAKLFDTAPAYGGGHSETLLGAALEGHDDVMVITKFGASVDPDTRRINPPDASPEGIRASIDMSRKRLRRDRIDLALFHLNDYPADESGPVFDTLAALRDEGKIGAFGWSTDFIDRARAQCDRPGFVAIEHDFNVFTPAKEMLGFIASKHLISLNRLPLAMGLLTGKFSAGAKPGKNDLRGENLPWMKFFRDGAADPDYLRRLEALRDLMQTGGRSLAQGALGWILARSDVTLPVPGFKTSEQIRDNLGALEKGPLPAETMSEIERVLGGFAAA